MSGKKLHTAEGLAVWGDHLKTKQGDPAEFVSIRMETRISQKTHVPIHVAVLRVTSPQTWRKEDGTVDRVYYEIVLPVTDLELG